MELGARKDQLRYFVCLPVANNSLFCLFRNSTARQANVRPNFTVSASITTVSPFFAALRKLQMNIDHHNFEIFRSLTTHSIQSRQISLVSFRMSPTLMLIHYLLKQISSHHEEYLQQWTSMQRIQKEIVWFSLGITISI